MHEFVPQRAAAYISQHDLHIAEMTVRETLAFSARCQGTGPRYGKHQLINFLGCSSYIVIFGFYIVIFGFLVE